MRIRLSWILFPALLFAAASTNPAGERWWRYVQTLADDKFEGRATASEGHRRAAEYVAAEFKRLGLKPAGTSGYRQPVPLEVRSIREPDSSLMLLRGGLSELLQLGEDAYFNLPTDPPLSLQAPAAFVGYGLTVPELSYDDLDGVDLMGKIAVLLRGGPASLPAPLRAHYQSLAERWGFLRKAGAIGIASIPDPRSMDIPWDRLKLLRLEPSMALSSPRREEMPGLGLSLTINPASADRFFVGTGHSMEEILTAAQEGKPLPKFPLSYMIRAVVAADRTKAVSANVAAILTGRDPKLREEYVVVSAHLDHLGSGSPVGGDSIYNGAMDDAAGIATLFEIARALKVSPPRRSVLFLAVTAEEKGLLGSKYFAASPTVKPQAIVADLNLDMFQPLHDLRRLTVYGLPESTLGPTATAVARKFRVVVQADPEPERNLFVRSDQYSFIRAGVPSLSFKFGFQSGSQEERIQKEWLAARYHAPSDDAAQPVSLAAAARFNRLIAALAAEVANQPQRPRWNQESFFRRFAEAPGQ
jgi:hypothetical protein